MNDEIIDCVQEFIFIRQKIGACLDHEKKIGLYVSLVVLV